MIGVFDSGVGGLSVLRALRAKMPHADFVYFGDTENAPYGNKSAPEIGRLIAMALRRLHAAGARDIVSACNSASVSVRAVPIDLLRMGVFTVVEMVEPTVDALAPRGKKIVLFGTNATINSGIYQEAFAERKVSVGTVAIPELAGLIERDAPREELLPIVREAVIQGLALGGEILSLSCTHYPFVRDLFQQCVREAGSSAEIFDPAESVAQVAASRLDGHGGGTLRFLISAPSAVFESQVHALFGSGYSIEPAGSIYWSLKGV